MKLAFIFYPLLFFTYASAQKPDIADKTCILDNLEDKYFYQIKIIVEKPFSSDSYHFMSGRAYNGFYVSGLNKKIDMYHHDTTRKKYQRLLLEKSQIDSLRQFELKLIALNNQKCDTPRLSFFLSTQVKNRSYLIKQDSGWNAIDELHLILFRQRE